jgi:cobalt-zinc-cadmium efflux system membrane fusion protein
MISFSQPKTILGAIAVVLLVLGLGCGGASRQDPSGGRDAREPALSAESGAENMPEGLCAEHGVLEALCAHCNPALAKVFQAKGDWCAEHGHPESFCPICHPERGGRPPLELSGDDGPADGTRIRFKSIETARLAGIEVEEATEAEVAADLVVTATVVYDPKKVAQVNARSEGVVREIRVDVGDRVKAGEPLAIVESATFGADQSRIQAEEARIVVAQSKHERLTRLHAEGIATERDVLEAMQELEAARADLAALQAALAVVGVAADAAARYELTSPVAGVVTRREVMVGRFVDTEEILFQIVDTSTMAIEIDVPEPDVQRVAVGQTVSITVDGVAGRSFSGELSYLAPEIDPHTRTAKGRVLLANPGGVLRANMFARARISLESPRGAVLVPRSSIQRASSSRLVFVQREADLFETRRVRLGREAGDRVEVIGRVAPGDQVVTAGSFLLKTEISKESIGTGCCEVEGEL